MNETLSPIPAMTDAQREQRARIQEEIDFLDDEPIDHIASNDLEAQLFRYIRRRTSLEAERDRLKLAMSAMLEDVERRIEGLDYVYQATCAEVTRSLLKGKSRSVKTPYGVAGFRKKSARVVVINEQELISAWQLETIPRSAVDHRTITTAKPVLSVLADLYEKTGEVAPGCEVIPAEDTFYVK